MCKSSSTQFARYENIKRKRCENEKWPQDKGDVKTEGVKGNNFNRKSYQIKVRNDRRIQETRKMVPSENRVKRMRCGEKRMSREGLKSQEKEMPKDRDAKRKRRQRKATETTSVSRDSDDISKACQERGVCQVSSPSAVDKKGRQDSEMSGASRIKRKWQHQTKMSRARNVKDKDFQEITQSTAVPARRRQWLFL